MTQQPQAPTVAPQPGAGPDYAGQHDTTALPRVPQGSAGYPPGSPAGSGYPPGYAPGHEYAPEYTPVNHEADAWQERFHRQRTRTRIAVALAALASATALVLGVATWQLANNSLLSSASDLAAGLSSGDLNLDRLAPGGATPDGTSPEGALPDGAADPAAPGADLPLSELPLPDSLKSLASTLGITDVGQLLDLAVSNGMMSQADADQLLAALAAGNALG